MKKTEFSRKIILSLIKDDLINMRLVHGLNNLGLNADDYTLNLSTTIFELMGIDKNDPVAERLLENYIDTTKSTTLLKQEELKSELDKSALEVYQSLILAKETFFK
jgi:hypothetical protein